MTQQTTFTAAVAPYAERKIDLIFQIGEGQYGDSGVEQIQLSGLRVEATIEHAQIADGGPNAIVRIYGMTLNHINQLTKAGLYWDTRKNGLVVKAGDDLSGMMTVFNGTIQEAYPDFNPPTSSFVVKASPAPIIQMKPVDPISFPGATDVNVALQTMARNARLALEITGVTTTLASGYYAGTTWDQIIKITEAANLFATIDGVNGVLAVWPKEGSRTGEPVTISAAKGMIGYPHFSKNQITVRTLFGQHLANLTRGPGTKIRVESQLSAATGRGPGQTEQTAAANGVFTVSDITLLLSSQLPDGPWEMVIVGYPAEVGGGGGA